MGSRAISLVLKAAMAILPITLFATGSSAATYKVLYSFKGAPEDGARPLSEMVMDKHGNLFGTTSFGGPGNNGKGFGTVFELSPGPDGAWTYSLIYAFHGEDGYLPQAGLVIDGSGNLYGTTNSGGEGYVAGGAFGAGTVFELTRGGGGAWTEKVLRSFLLSDDADGIFPAASLLLDGKGNLYGTTQGGGSPGGGTVFELTPAAGGEWTETILHNFGEGVDGTVPNGLIFDDAGNLYGSTQNGGPYDPYHGGDGTVFELTPNKGGGWTETVLHSFGAMQNSSGFSEAGFYPYSGVAFDGSGNLYGTTFAGGKHDYGAVYELKPGEGGGWTEEVVHSFHTDITGGYYPLGGVTFDGKGNFYGTTQYGGANGDGELFEYTPRTGGGWQDTVLHDFGHKLDGSVPQATLYKDAAGNLYGTTEVGGTHGAGTVFEIIP